MKYPIGIQDFRELREGGYVYVDKTQQLFSVVDSGKYFFLSRPRRFGKSLLLSTMNELYSGSKKLFQGLWIDEHWDFEAERRPVIWIQFAGLAYKKRGLGEVLSEHMDQLAAELGIQLNSTTPQDKFRQLVHEAGKDRKVAVLIDEYDKPIIDFLDDTPRAEANRDELKSFYSVLKDSDRYLEMVFITGVSAFSKVSIFPDLNHLNDLTLHPMANELVGITQREVEATFDQQLKNISTDALKQWYNGYRWGADTSSYNPFSLLSFLQSKVFRSYWFATGTPSFLVRLIADMGKVDSRDIYTTPDKLLNFDLRHLDVYTVLFQTGYLTIKTVIADWQILQLDYPNREVRFSFDQLVLEDYLQRPDGGVGPRIWKLGEALKSRDVREVVTIINATFAEIPSQLWQNREQFFHALTHLIFSLLGAFVRSEVNSARGRCDALVETEKYIYAFEFKRDRSAAAALEQITRKGYLLPYADSPKQRLAVGINFSTAQRQIDDWKVAEH